MRPLLARLLATTLLCAGCAALDYPREGSTSDQVIYAYFSKEVVEAQPSATCIPGPGGRGQICGLDTGSALPTPAREFDPARDEQVVFVIRFKPPEDHTQVAIKLAGRIIAPNGGSAPFTATIPARREADWYWYYRRFPLKSLGQWPGIWKVMVALDERPVGTYAFMVGDAETIKRLKANPPPPQPKTEDVVAAPPDVDANTANIPALRRALNDSSTSVRAKAIAELVAILRAGTPVEMSPAGREALKTLEQLPKPMLIDFLKTHPDSHVRLEMAAMLGRVGPGPEGTAALIDALRDVSVREDAANALKPMVKTLLPALSEDLRSGAPPARRRAALTLRWIAPAAPEEILALLTRGIEDDDAEVKSTSIQGIAATGTDALPVLRTAMQHSDPRVRSAAVAEIGNFGFHADGDVDALRAIAQRDPSDEVRTQAEEAIRKIQGR
jgi:HEAT repeat protein